MTRLIPRQSVPELSVPIVGADPWSLAEQTPNTFTLVAFYRGLHCPICRGWLGSLEKTVGDFAERGVDVIAISMDTRDRAEKSKEDWRLADVPLGYALPEGTARDWGLYFSEGIGDEPTLFSEPGLFIIRPDGELYFAAVQTMPFTRPAFKELVGAVDYAVEHDYPARGERV